MIIQDIEYSFHVLYLKKTAIKMWLANINKTFLFSFQIETMLKSTFLFLTNLAYKNRFTIPFTVAFLVCNFSWEIEISIQTERIQLQANHGDNDDVELLSDFSDNDDEFEPVTGEDLTDDSNEELI